MDALFFSCFTGAPIVKKFTTKCLFNGECILLNEVELIGIEFIESALPKTSLKIFIADCILLTVRHLVIPGYDSENKNGDEVPVSIKQ